MSNPASSFRQQVLRGLAWQGAAQFFGQLISWAATLLVIRLLEPSDYGLMAIATVFLSLAMILADLGFGSAVIQADELEREDLGSVQTLALLLAGAAGCITFFGAGLVAHFFDEPRLIPVLRVLSVSFPLSALYLVPSSVLIRDLRFDQKAKVDVVAIAGSSIASLAMALLGFGVWSLVTGGLAMHFFRILGYNIACGGFVRPSASLERGLRFFRFGSLVMVERLLWQLNASIDVLIAGKILGKVPTGLYSVTLTLSSLPLEKIAPTLTQVSFSAYSRIQRESDRVRTNLMRAIRYGVFVFVPLFWGLVLVAPDALPLLLGAKWENIVIPFQLIAAVVPIRALGVIMSPALLGVGKPEIGVTNMVIRIVTMGSAFFVGAHYGLIGLSLAWAIVYPLVSAVMIFRMLKGLDLAVRDLTRGLYKILIAGFAMVAAVLTVQLVMSQTGPWARILACSAIGAFVYAAVIWFAERPLLLELRGLASQEKGA